MKYSVDQEVLSQSITTQSFNNYPVDHELISHSIITKSMKFFLKGTSFGHYIIWCPSTGPACRRLRLQDDEPTVSWPHVFQYSSRTRPMDEQITVLIYLLGSEDECLKLITK